MSIRDDERDLHRSEGRLEAKIDALVAERDALKAEVARLKLSQVEASAYARLAEENKRLREALEGLHY